VSFVRDGIPFFEEPSFANFFVHCNSLFLTLLFPVSSPVSASAPASIAAADPPEVAAPEIVLVGSPPPVDSESGTPNARRFPVPFSPSDLKAFAQRGEKTSVSDFLCHELGECRTFSCQFFFEIQRRSSRNFVKKCLLRTVSCSEDALRFVFEIQKRKFERFCENYFLKAF
jgi:hypothetical protein